MKISFYNVKKRASVEVEEKSCKKVVYDRETSKGKQQRYAVRAKDEGTSLTKFISKETFDGLKCPVEKAK